MQKQLQNPDQPVQPVDLARLTEGLAQVAMARSWSPQTLPALRTLLLEACDEDLLRISPLRFAAGHVLDESEAIDLFLFATKAGLVQLEWTLFCAACGCIVESLKSLNTVHAHYRCELCAGETDAGLDDYIAVYFKVSPALRPIAFHHPETLSPEDYYFKYKYSGDSWFAGGVIPELPEAEPTRDFFRARTKVLAQLQPAEEQVFELELGPDFFALDESVHQSQTFYFVSGEPESQLQSQILVLGDPAGPPGQLRPGKLRLIVRNHLDRPAHIFAPNLPASLFELRQAGVRLAYPLLGNRLLTHARFKELFRDQLVATDEGIGIHNLTLLFTDLKGSTDLYDRIGDIRAFALVREHFEQLSRIIGRHRGVVVKTIGDAVMAAFAQPVDGVRCACAILEGIEERNLQHGTQDILLKLGLHQGPVIAVTLNEHIDYFGQTVNIAARVQALADANEIFLTDSLYQAPGIAELFCTADIQIQNVKLKGIAEKLTLYKVVR